MYYLTALLCVLLPSLTFSQPADVSTLRLAIEKPTEKQLQDATSQIINAYKVRDQMRQKRLTDAIQHEAKYKKTTSGTSTGSH